MAIITITNSHDVLELTTKDDKVTNRKWIDGNKEIIVDEKDPTTEELRRFFFITRSDVLTVKIDSTTEIDNVVDLPKDLKPIVNSYIVSPTKDELHSFICPSNTELTRYWFSFLNLQYIQN